MQGNKVHYRHLMLFFHRKGKNAAQSRKKICAVYDESAIAELCRGDLLGLKLVILEDKEPPGRHSILMKIRLKL